MFRFDCKNGGLLFVLTLTILPSSWSAASVRSIDFKLKNRILQIDVLSDTLIHAQLTSTATSPSSRRHPISVTPMVFQTKFSGPSVYSVSGHAFETPALKVSVNPATLCIHFYDKIKDQSLTTLCPNATGISLSKDSMENAYGLGEQFVTPGEANGDWVGRERIPGTKYGNALLDFQGGMVENAQFPILYAIGKGTLNYALFVDHTPAQAWHFLSDPWTMETAGASLRFFFIGGKDLPELRSQYMNLVGRPPVPPKKALGLWVSEFGYKDWQEMEGKLQTLRQHHFPIDGFVLDLYWFGPFGDSEDENNFGRLSFDKDHFPNPEAKLAALDKDEGVGIATIEESYVNSHLIEYKWLMDKGYFVRTQTSPTPFVMNSWWGKGSMIDWTSDKASAAWHDLKRQKIIDQGVMVHWTDLGEPENYSEESFYAGVPGISGNGETEMHNLYNFKWSESIAAGYARNHVLRRPFILSRSGTSGIQRFGDALWSGDIGSNLKSLSAHLNAQMHMSFSGIDYFGSDVGGFHREGLEGDLDEVYTRWFAHSSLFDLPVRPHTNNGNKKNDTPPDRIGDLKSNLFNIRQRYELSPYYYGLAYQAYLGGVPVIPPPLFYYQSDENLRRVSDEKLIGRYLLAATGAKDGETERSVYLPAGRWMEIHTKTWYNSTGTSFPHIAEFQNGIFRLPLFAREGAIIPRMKVDDRTMNILGKRTDHTTDSELRLTILPSAKKSGFTLYEDDGETVDYRSGAFATTRVTQKEDRAGFSVVIHKTKGSFKGQNSMRSVRLDLYTPKVIAARTLVNGVELPRLKSLDDLEKMSQGWCTDGANHISVKTNSVGIRSSLKIRLFGMR